MKNPWLVLMQFLLSFGTMVTGIWFSYVLFGNDLPTLISCVIFLLGLYLPFLWFVSIVQKRELVDSIFVLEQTIWHIYLIAAFYKLSLFPNDPIDPTGISDVFIFLVFVTVCFVLRKVTHNSFLKQER